MLSILIGTLALSINLLLAQAASSPEPQTNEVDTLDFLYRAHSDFYFLRRDTEFKIEMMLRESCLSWFYQNLAQEASVRAYENPSATLEALTPPELTGFDETNYALEELPEDAPLRIRYIAYEKYIRNEFNHKYLQARLIKESLLNSATNEQRKRMFKRDVESAILAYRDESYRDALFRFDECINSYGYTDIADIVFYRAETQFALHFFDLAYNDYLFVIKNSTDTKMRNTALEKLIMLAGDKNNISAMMEFWSQYKEEFGTQNDKYWDLTSSVGKFLFNNNKWQEAREIFLSIPQQSPKYAEAQLYAGNCSLALIELDDAEMRFKALLEMPKGKKDDSRIIESIKQNAQLRLGYINFMRGEYDLAFVNFNKIKGDDETAEHAELMCIWSLYKLNAYLQVQQLCNEFINAHPNSQYLYEVRCLLGFTQEMMGSPDRAIKDYRTVMDALDDRQDYHDYNYELKAISEALSELGLMEEIIFVKGEKELFPDYLALRRELISLTNKVKTSRAIKTTPLLKDIIKEQIALSELFAQQEPLEQQLYDAQNPKLYNQYRKIIDDLIDNGSELYAATMFYMKQKSVIQREQDVMFESLMIDSLRSSLDREWNSILEAINLTRATLSECDEPEILVNLAGLEIDFHSIQDRILKIRYDLTKLRQEQEYVKSNLDEWSDFAYQRYTFGGLNFDNLYAQQQRLDALDQYIQKTGQILRERIEKQESAEPLPAELATTTKPGDKPYYAPMVPLWGSTPSTEVGEPTPPRDDSSIKIQEEPSEPLQPQSEPTKEEITPPESPIEPSETPAEPEIEPGGEPTPEPELPETPTETEESPSTENEPSIEPPIEPEPPPSAGEQYLEGNYNSEVDN